MPLISMGAIPSWHAARRPTAIAVVHDGIEITWSELAFRTARRAEDLHAKKVRTGDLVALLLPNGNEFVETCFAIWLAGATPLPLSPHLPHHELAELLALAQPRSIISRESLPPLSIGRTDNLDRAILPERPPAPQWKAMASGGSTGRPKLILSDREATTDPDNYELFPWEMHHGRLGEPNGVMLNSGPLYHNGPFVHSFMNLFSGSTLVGMSHFDPETWLRLVEHYRARFSYLVPTMMRRIWAVPPERRQSYDLSSLNGVIHTAAPCPRDLKEAWIDWLGPERIWEAYGSTEAVASSVINGEEWRAHPGSVGRFYFGSSAQVVGDAGTIVQPGEIGELWVRRARGLGPGFTYIGDEPREADGWYSFGDLAAIDVEGYVYIADRRTDLIIRGGNNIYPAEIEAALESHPLVASAAVLGLPDEDLGARVHAIVQPRERHALTIAVLEAYLESRLVYYKRPTSYEFIDHSLRNDAGKVRRSELRAQRIGQ